jgi:hypothetical protein
VNYSGLRLMVVKLKHESVDHLVIPDMSSPISKRVMEDIALAVTGEIREGIIKQKKLDGSELTFNEPKTIEIKRQGGRTHGGRVKSLIDRKRRFIGKGQKSYKISATKKRAVIGFATPRIGKIAKHLQDGIRTKRAGLKRYTGWFGISKKAITQIEKIVAKAVRTTVKKFKVKRVKK